MAGQMCWLPKFGGNSELILHLRLDSFQTWKPYNQFPGVAVPDYRIAGGSKGYATAQKLLKAGWTYVSTAQVRESEVDAA